MQRNPAQPLEEGDGGGGYIETARSSCVADTPNFEAAKWPVGTSEEIEDLYGDSPSAACDSKSPSSDILLTNENKLRERLRRGTTHAIEAGKADIQLRIAAKATHRGFVRQVSILVDTGAEVSLVKSNLFPETCMQKATNPIKLTVANATKMVGGQREALLQLGFDATDRESGRKVRVETPSLLYEADITQDMIVSYRWLADRHFDVCPRRHGVQGVADNRIIWIPGEREDKGTVLQGMSDLQAVEWVHAVGQGPKRALDLFSGIGSATRVLQHHGYQVTTLDMDPKCQADITIDIRNWSPEEFAAGYFYVVVACPPCTEYSQAMTKRQRRLEEADSIIKKTLEVIQYLKPRLWVMENPRNGLLPKSELVQHLPFVDCDQCQFADYGYQKPTSV